MKKIVAIGAVVSAMLIGCQEQTATNPPARAGYDEGRAAYNRGDFDEGMAAAKRGDYATALREWRPLADQGEARAQHNLGVMYPAWPKLAHGPAINLNLSQIGLH